MAEAFILTHTNKAERYKELIPQLLALIETETDLYANLANITAGLKEAFDFFWVGFYLVKEGELVLGPFQGPVACTRIAFGKGVCGTSWAQKETILVPDVERFPGHIACNAASKSEIVVPIHKDGNVLAVLDVDSADLNDFDATDQLYLEELTAALVSKF